MNNMEKLPLEEATNEQIRTFARNFLQLEGADDKDIKKVRADVDAAWPHKFFWLAKAPEAIQVTQPADAPMRLSKAEIDAKAGPGIAASSSKNDPLVDLIIPKQDGPGGKDPVYVNVNGNAMHVARGIPQLVPYRFFHDLENTVQRIHEWNEKTSVVTHEDVTRFPLNIRKMPSDDEIYEFERLDAQRSGQVFTRDQFDARRATASLNRGRDERQAEHNRLSA